jgi:hypothetical protein
MECKRRKGQREWIKHETGGTLLLGKNLLRIAGHRADIEGQDTLNESIHADSSPGKKMFNTQAMAFVEASTGAVLSVINQESGIETYPGHRREPLGNT